MKPIQLATIVLLLGAVTSALYSQPPGYSTPPGSPPEGYDDHGYDNPGYDDRGYDDDRGYADDRSPQVDVGFFYDELSPYGDWALTRDYGWAWFPRDVRPDWRPYSDGRWVPTDYGWTWASNERFGWATYHYGRWARDARFGWLWVPGTIWGPAWVSWQYGGGYVGWAPLPPSVGFEIGVGIRLGSFDLNIGIRPDAYSFVQERSFLDTRLSGHLIPPARNVTIIHNTTNITNYTYVDNRVVNRGVEVRRIEQVTGRRVRALRVAELRSRRGTEVADSELRIYRPERRQLDSVRVGPRANAGQRAETPPGRDGRRPSADRRDAPDFEVAPRAERVPRTDTRQVARQERRAQEDLKRYQADEKRQLEKLHGQEIGRARAQAERSQVEKRHRDEREALQQEQQSAGQQLEARQKAQRQAQASPPGRRISEGDKEKGKQPKGNGRGRQGERPARPPV
jgi:hypothetical protein